MTLYRYTNSQARDYPNLEHGDGIGLRLEPGDTVELDDAPVDVFEDGEVVASHYPGCPWLVPADSVTNEIASLNAAVADITAAVGLRPPSAPQPASAVAPTSKSTDTAGDAPEPSAAD